MDKSYCADRAVTTVITAGSNYLDIDAYACCVAMKELLVLQGEKVVAYSSAVVNYSVCQMLVEDGQLLKNFPSEIDKDDVKYIIVDVSDPNYIKDSVPLEKVAKVYDHHVGYEDYWRARIGDGMHIEFIGAAATLIYREWKNAGLQDKMSPSTARLLVAAILDNTLNLNSSNTTAEDVEAYKALCRKGNIDDSWREIYFSHVQESVDADLKNALFNDLKTFSQCEYLPPSIAQLCVWDVNCFFERLGDVRRWFDDLSTPWMINLIDINKSCSYFVCDDSCFQKKIQDVFGVFFQNGVAKSKVPYLRKEILKVCISNAGKGK